MLKKYRIVFSNEALVDFNEAKTWYNKQQRGLGKRFGEDVKLVFEAIKRNPYHASIKYYSIRTSACNTFPYAVHYEIDESETLVRVISIFHFSRKPKWLE